MSALPFSHKSAMDTISFTIEAPDGHFISKVIYAQEESVTGRPISRPAASPGSLPASPTVSASSR